jgi:hypothetical protein
MKISDMSSKDFHAMIDLINDSYTRLKTDFNLDLPINLKSIDSLMETILEKYIDDLFEGEVASEEIGALIGSLLIKRGWTWQLVDDCPTIISPRQSLCFSPAVYLILAMEHGGYKIIMSDLDDLASSKKAGEMVDITWKK